MNCDFVQNKDCQAHGGIVPRLRPLTGKELFQCYFIQEDIRLENTGAVGNVNGQFFHLFDSPEKLLLSSI